MRGGSMDRAARQFWAVMEPSGTSPIFYTFSRATAQHFLRNKKRHDANSCPSWYFLAQKASRELHIN